MTNQILISFCNLPIPKKNALVLLELFEANSFNHIQSQITINFPPKIKSATGITRGSGLIYVLFTREDKTYIAILDEGDFHFLKYQELPEVSDPHSILYLDSEIFIVSTGTDEVIMYHLTRENELINSRVFWKASDSKSDTHHVNSIILSNGDIIISAFGEKKDKGWPSAQNGYIYNTTKNEIIKQGIYHPHTLTARNGRIYYCESKRNKFRSVGMSDYLFKFESYTRGVAWLSDTLVCVANSNRGKNTLFRRILTKMTNRDFIRGASTLYLLDIMQRKLLNVIDLSMNGPEVYDILAIK